MKVDFVDLKREYRDIQGEVDSALLSTVQAGRYILGENVESFEKEFSAFSGTKFAAGVASGSDALKLSLEAYGIGNGDEVITVSHTFVSTVDAISRNGAKPVLVDIDPDSYTIDTSVLEKSVTPKTKAIIPVHLYGLMAEMKPVLEIAQKHSLKVIEDACQAHGASYNGHKAGAMGDCGCFSFYPAKNLGCYGDGGMVVSSDEEFIDRVRMLREYGQKKKYYHSFIGHNSRLDEIQAAILRIKLRRLRDWNKSRQEISELYSELLDERFSLPRIPNDRDHIFHLYVVRVKERDGTQEMLKRAGIATGIHYPIPVHKQEAYDLKLSLPITERCCTEILSLPMFPFLSDEEVSYVCDTLNSVEP